MTGVSIQDNTDKRIYLKALPGRRRGHRVRRDGGGMGRQGQRICHRQWRRELNEICRKETAGRKDQAGLKDAQVDGAASAGGASGVE